MSSAELSELTETIRPPATKIYGDYARSLSSRRGILRHAMRGPKNSRADALLKKF